MDLIKKFTVPLPELEAYYREQRIRRYKKHWMPNIQIRRKMWPLIAIFLKLDRIFSRRKITCLVANHYKTEHPLLFACAHVGRYDIEAALETIGQSVFIFFGDPGETYRNFDGIMLYLNGRICMDRFDKQNRFIGKETAVLAE